MSLHNGAYSHPGYSAPPYSQGYHHPPGGHMYANGHGNTQVHYYTPGHDTPLSTSSSTHCSQQQHLQPYWYGRPPRSSAAAAAAGVACSPETDRFNRKRRRCTYMYYVLRQMAIFVPIVVVFLNINIYVSRRGRYLNDSTSPADPIFYTLWLTVPISCLVLLWSVVAVLCRKRAPRRGGIPKHFHFGMELCFSLGTTVCWILLVIQIESKKSNGYYSYPYIQYEAALAFLLGIIMLSEFGLLARAWFEFTHDKTRHENEAMVQVHTHTQSVTVYRHGVWEGLGFGARGFGFAIRGGKQHRRS